MNNNTRFSIADAWESALTKLWNNLGTFFCVNLIWVICFYSFYGGFAAFINNYSEGSISSYHNLISFYSSPQLIGFFDTHTLFIFPFLLMNIFIFFAWSYVYFQNIMLAFALAKGEQISIHKAFSYSFKTFLRFCVAQFILLSKVILGLIFFIIPGIYLLTKNFFAGYPIAENPELSYQEDTTINHAITRGNRLKIFFLSIIIISITSLFNFLGSTIGNALFFGPLFRLMWVNIFLQLKKESGSLSSL